MKEKLWAVFGKWAFASLITFLLISGIAFLLGKIEGVNRLAGLLFILLAAWMTAFLYKSRG